MTTDKELLKLARKFDPVTLADIYDTFSPGLYRYAMRLTGDQDLAEECVADTFSRLLQAFSPEKVLRFFASLSFSNRPQLDRGSLSKKTIRARSVG